MISVDFGLGIIVVSLADNGSWYKIIGLYEETKCWVIESLDFFFFGMVQ